jgi:hypothetical protein
LADGMEDISNSKKRLVPDGWMNLYIYIYIYKCEKGIAVIYILL